MIRFRYTKTLLIFLIMALFLLCVACGSSEEVGEPIISERPAAFETDHSSQTSNSSMPEVEPESVSGTASNTDSASDEAVLNPETPGMTSSQENEFIRANNERNKMFDDATNMENHLRSVLSDSDHGGISIFMGSLGDTLEDTANDADADTPRLIIYAINKDAINKAIQSYTGKQCKVIIKDAKWSLEDMNNFKQVLEKIELHNEESLDIKISEDYNNIKVEVSNADNGLKREINVLIQANSIPDDCVLILTFEDTSIDPSVENPVT